MYIYTCSNTIYKIYLLKFIFYCFSFSKYIYLTFKNKLNSLINKIDLMIFHCNKTKTLAFFNLKKKDICLVVLISQGFVDVCINISILYNIYISINNENSFEIYLSSFLFLIGILINLIKITKIWVKNNQLREEFPILYNIVKCILLSLLIINLVVLFIIGKKLLVLLINYLKKLFFNTNIMHKLKDLKLSIDYKKVKNNKPKKPKISIFSDLRNKKKDKKKAFYLKEKIFNIQKRNLNNSSNTTFNKTSFSKRRGWNQTINLGDNPKFTANEQLNNVRSEFKAYDIQEKKFKKIIIDINKGKENFYPEESKSLFKEYITVVKILKKNLKYVEKNIKNTLK